jgi:glycosyltransferase involved in cell wall biosynthesis
MTAATTHATLMVIVPDRLSELASKGEMVPRYYNPGNLFRHVHLVMSTADTVDPERVRAMVGDAELTVHSFAGGIKTFLRTAGWRPRLLRRWADPIVALARQIRPSLVRCHGNSLNAFAASEIKRRLGIPYAVSLHTNPDVDHFRGRSATTLKRRILGRALEAVEIIGIQRADFVLPVYTPIVPYLRKHGVARWEVVYNAVGHTVRPKEDYAITRGQVRAICVGRQQSQEKDPSPIIEAVADLPEVHLTLVGNGDLHQALQDKVAALGIGDRVTFHAGLPNDQVLELCSWSDFMVYSSHYYELSKGCIEAALAGLPAILNDRGGDPAAELVGDHFLLVADTRDAYRTAMRRMIDDDAFRERLGRTARAHAVEHWAPERMEQRIVEIYRDLLGEAAP